MHAHFVWNTGQEAFCMWNDGFCHNDLQWQDWHLDFKSGAMVFIHFIHTGIHVSYNSVC